MDKIVSTLKYVAIVPALVAGWTTISASVYHIDGLIWLVKNYSEIKRTISIISDDNVRRYDVLLSTVDILVEHVAEHNDRLDALEAQR